jgi:hypothetical protein
MQHFSQGKSAALVFPRFGAKRGKAGDSFIPPSTFDQNHTKQEESREEPNPFLLSK